MGRSTTNKVAKVAGGSGAVLALGASLISAGAPAGAATFTVTNANDSGAGSLRQAIIDANLAVGADTITFGPAVTDIAVTTGEMAITDDVVIDGAGAVTIDAGSNSRIFYINDAGAVTITGLTLHQGRESDEGGAVRSLRTDLTVADTIVSGSVAEWGGGVFVEYGTATITNTTFTDNFAYDYGGGLAVYEATSATVTGSTFEDNATYGDGAGAIFDDTATVSISDTTFTENYAEENGGGFDLQSVETLSVVTSTFTDNIADEDGAGFHVGDVYGSLTLTDTTFTGNIAYSDGGGFEISGVNGTTIAVSGVTATDNAAPNDQGGGGFFAGIFTSDLTIADSTFSGNTGNLGGGLALGYLPETTVAITGSTFVDNEAIPYDGEGSGFGVGGGIYMAGSSDNAATTVTTISTSTFDANEADYGGGLTFDNAGTVTIDSSTISNNVARGNGGGVISVVTEVTVVNSTVSGNTAEDGGGGLDLIGGGGNLDISHSTITGNTASYGGGLLLSGEGTATIDHTLVDGNTATGFQVAAPTEGVYGEAIFVMPEYSQYQPEGPQVAALESVTLTNSIVNGTVAGEVIDAGGNQFEVAANLGPLADNGGPTQTHDLLAGSAAINTGDAAFAGDPTTDQRGLPRVSNGTIDVGAVEVQVQTPVPPVEPAPPAEPVPADPTFTG